VKGEGPPVSSRVLLPQVAPLAGRIARIIKKGHQPSQPCRWVFNSEKSAVTLDQGGGPKRSTR